jgi:uncharacterized protein YyaL (SSP411 family)
MKKLLNGRTMKNRTPRYPAWVPILLLPFLANCSAQQNSPDGPGKAGAGAPASANGRPANRLKDATSPYLLQHAHNPVDWYPWGEEAFKKARDEDKPIFLSVGYSACHWCHVMERECFENEELAKQLNASFVAIKVDREERPDIDELYMRYLHLSGGRGGWPMSVFLTPDGEPFYGGTYFPPRQFARLMSGLSEAWEKERDQIIRTARNGADALRENANAEYRAPERPLSSETSTRAVAMLSASFDWKEGGIQAPRKFPPHATLEWLLDRVERGDEGAREREMLVLTLDKMQSGGIHDHVGGGFHRYATDTRWFLPHFEKMLYDNAQLGRIYARAANVLGRPSYAETARGIYAWVLREMTSPEGAFYSSLDADSEGEEGRFYVWSSDEIHSILGSDAASFSRIFGIEGNGNFEEEASGRPTGRNVLALSRAVSDADRTTVQRMLQTLLAARAKRVRPHLDDKILTGWNALTIGSLAESGRLLDEKQYIAKAEKAAIWLLANLRDQNGRWRSSYRAGSVSGNATLDDHAYLASAFLDLFQATGNAKWRDEAAALVRLLDRHFRDEKKGGYFSVADDHEKLLARMKNPADNATPSGNGIAVQVLMHLARETGDPLYRKRAEEAFHAFHAVLDLAPMQVESLLRAFERAVQYGWYPRADADREVSDKVKRGPVLTELLVGSDKLVAGRPTPIAVRLILENGYHVQGAEGDAGVTSPTRFRVVSKDVGALGKIQYPTAGRLKLPEIGEVAVHSGTVVLLGWLNVPADSKTGNRTLSVEVDFQACRGDACLAPETVTLALPVDVIAAGEARRIHVDVFAPFTNQQP